MLQLRAYFMILGGGMLAVFCLGILADVFELRMNGGPLGSFNFGDTIACKQSNVLPNESWSYITN
jgi:hypothetical protein